MSAVRSQWQRGAPEAKNKSSPQVAAFCLMGLLRMICHAQQAIDAGWAWWVFGITTGRLTLVGLAMLEKNNPKLQRHLDQLAAWEV